MKVPFLGASLVHACAGTCREWKRWCLCQHHIHQGAHPTSLPSCVGSISFAVPGWYKGMEKDRLPSSSYLF